MRLALAAGGALLLALLTWLLLSGINTHASAYAETQRAFDDFALAETSIGRDVLQARAGLLGNYDVLAVAEEAMESAASRIRLHVEAENLDRKPVEALAAAVGQYEDLIERFKTGNSLLQNSLSYIGQLSTDPAFGALGDQFAPSATALAAAVLRLAGDSSPESAKSLQQHIDRFEAQAPAGGLEGEAAHALLAHARLLSDLLPEVDQTLRALVAAPSRQPFEETRELLARAKAASEVTAQRFRVLLYAVSLGLLVIALRLGQRLWTRTLRIRRLVDANIIGIFIWELDGRITEANDAFLRMVGYDHADIVSGRIRWTELTPPEWLDRDERGWLPELKVTGSLQPFEKEYFRKDGSRVPVLIGAAIFEGGGNQGVAFVLDLTERKRVEERLRVQHTVAQILAEAVTIEEATLRILRAMGECLGWDVGALWRVDREAEALRCVELWHKASIEVPEFERVSREFTFGPGLGLPGRVWSSLEPEYIPDVVSDDNFPRAPIAEREGLCAAFGFPILFGGEVLGVIEFFSREIRQPDQELLNVLATIGSQIGQFIERKRGEEALRESEAKFRDYAETASDWLWETGPDYKFTLLTENAFGSHAADRIGTVFWDHVLDLETESEKWRLLQETVFSRKPFRDFVYRGMSSDGSPMYVRASGKPLFDANREFRGYRGTCSDVTEIMRAQEALRESERSLRSAIDGIAGLVAVMAPNGELDAINRQVIEYFGRSLEEMKNWGTSDAVHPEDLPRIAEILKRSLVTGTAFHYELRLRRFDGEYRWFDNRGVPIREKSGRIVRWYILGTDIEDRTRALARLEQMQSDFAHMNRVSMMGELAGSLSHEITQPIAAARNYARAALNFLGQQAPDLGEVKKALGSILGAADRSVEIIERIRDHIKKAPPRKTHFDLNHAIDEVIALAGSAIARNGVSVQTVLAEGLAPVRGDRVQLQQVVLNLVLNAIEAMGSVDAGPRELSISTEQNQTNGVLVAVRDSGPGLDPENLERVFETFYTTKASGMGMGLSICRSIIDAHGGRLWAGVNEPRGAVFQFTLPSTESELKDSLQALHQA